MEFDLLAHLGDRALNDDSRRLFHGRGHCYPGWEWLTIDWYRPVAVAILYKDPGTARRAALQALLASWLAGQPALESVVIQHRYRKPVAFEHLGREVEEVCARRGPLSFQLNLGERQNVGYFLDMEMGRQWLEQFCRENPGSRGLNLFSYTAAFSSVALAAGAAEVVNADMSRGALATAQLNHQRCQLRGGRFLKVDIFKSWKKLSSHGPYDWVVVDPPSYQPGSFVAPKDYHKLLRHLPKVLQPDTRVLLCLNSPNFSAEDLQDWVADSLPALQFIRQLPAHDDFPESDRRRGLKLCLYAWGGNPAAS